MNQSDPESEVSPHWSWNPAPVPASSEVHDQSTLPPGGLTTTQQVESAASVSPPAAKVTADGLPMVRGPDGVSMPRDVPGIWPTSP